MSKIKFQGNASGTGVLTITSPNTNNDRTITLPDEDITLGGGVDGIVSTANATAITINSSEKVGIGIADAQHMLHIKENSTSNSLASGVKVQITNEQGAGNFASLRFTGSNQNGFIGYRDGANDQDRRISIGIGADAEHISFSQAGIKFNGDTASANALDDYEYGTWTPQNSSGTAYSLNGVARYVKVGNLVTFACDINQLTSGYSVFGLPFNAESTSAGSVAFGYTSYGAGVMAYVTTPAKFNIHQLDGNSIGANNHRFILTGKYITTQ